MTAPSSVARNGGHRGAFIAVVAVLVVATVFAPVRTIYKHNHKAAAAAGEVVIQNYAFSPAVITVKKGTQITFSNKDGAAHTVTSDDGTFDLGRIEGGGSMVYVATQTVSYHCDFHNVMHGQIVVEG
jgi:plastocyanin